MFVGRERELAILERLYGSKKFHLALVYGRRRIGKTTLLTEFTRRKECIYFTPLETSARQNTELFCNLLKRYQFSASLGLTTANSISQILEKLFEYSVNEHFVLVLDEYHLLTKGEKKLLTAIEELIIRYKDTSKMMLVLCSSSMPAVEKEILSEKNLLLSQSSCQIHLKPFGFLECVKFFKNTSSIDLAYIYGMVGGVPDYLVQINERLSLEDNIKNLFLNPSAHIYSDPAVLLQPEVREPSLYNAILSAIAGGASKLSEIAQVIGEETSVCAAYLKTMLLLEIVQKETPATETSAKKTIYRISDPVYRFWFSFLPELLSDIQQHNPDAAYKKLHAGLPAYMAEVFEDICREYLVSLEQANKTPFKFEEIGRWWGIDPFTRERHSISIVASDHSGSMLFGACKWSAEKMDLAELNDLKAQSELFSCTESYYYLFSRAGFTKTCQDLANKDERIILVSFSK